MTLSKSQKKKMSRKNSMEKTLDVEALRSFLTTMTPETKIYIGGDSKRIKRAGVWYADYTTVVVVHMNGKNGGRIFGESVRERVFDPKNDKPRQRLMTEVYKISEMYLRIADIIDKFDVQIHLDLNSKRVHNSNLVVQEAIGYIRGTCNMEPQIKPEAWAASYCADRLHDVWRNTKKVVESA